jgi:acetyl CoA:N6-hydroxylysine acetyl transferase
METISRTLPNTFSTAMNNHHYGLQQVSYPDDLPLLHQWMHTDHVIPQWQLNKPKVELHVFFEKMLADDHQRLYLITLDGEPIGYAEIYECYRDRIARYYDAKQHDMGIHLLFGEPSVLGKGHFRPTVSMLAEFIFSNNSTTEKMIIEPDSEVPAFQRAANDLGLEEQKKITLPEKTASLLFLFRDQFHQSPCYQKLILKSA